MPVSTPLSQIFFLNYTDYAFIVSDSDGTQYGYVRPKRYNGLVDTTGAGSVAGATFALPFSGSYPRPFTLTYPSTGQSVSFQLDRSGNVVNLNASSGLVQLGAMLIGQYNIVVDVMSINGLSIYPSTNPPQPYRATTPADFSEAVFYYNYY
jgi:hypothetical protein